MRKITTPVGELNWCTITGEGKENLSGVMQYKADLILEPVGVNEEHDAFVKSIDKYWTDNKPKDFKRKPKSTGVYFCDNVLDKDGKPTENEDGDKVYDVKGRRALRFKTAVTWPDGKPKLVKTFNSKAKPVHLGDTRIGNGSIGVVSGIMDIYTSVKDAGVTLYLDKIMILKLLEDSGENPFGAMASDEYDFEDTEESFVGSSEEAAPAKGTPRI